ncbi:MAG: hypothetical protein ACI9WC_000036 [Arenicella sp.]|jgi:hypothetical protein
MKYIYTLILMTCIFGNAHAEKPERCESNIKISALGFGPVASDENNDIRFRDESGQNWTTELNINNVTNTPISLEHKRILFSALSLAFAGHFKINVNGFNDCKREGAVRQQVTGIFIERN